MRAKDPIFKLLYAYFIGVVIIILLALLFSSCIK